MSWTVLSQIKSVALILASHELWLMCVSLLHFQMRGPPKMKMMWPRLDLVLLMDMDQMFLGEEAEASCGPQFASVKAVGIKVEELWSGKGKVMKFLRLSLELELKEIT